MSKSDSSARFSLHYVALWLLPIIPALGCLGEEQIRHYQVPREERQTTSPSISSAQESIAQRMLAALIPHQQQAWYFKLMGPVEAVSKIDEAYVELVRSVSFENEKPTWNLPQGWQQEDGDQIRYSTIRAGELKVSVTSLPLPPDDFQAYLLSNVNRWRGQLNLPPTTAEELSGQVQEIDVDGSKATIVDLTGAAAPGSNRPPFANMPQSNPPAASSGSDDMRYTVPDGWSTGPPRSMRMATFEITGDGEQAEITIIALGPAAGGVLDNVNRWRGQIGLDAIEGDQLSRDIRKIDVDGSACDFAVLVGSEKTILVVIIPRPGKTIFVKLLGDKALAAERQAEFEAFVESIRFL